MSGHGLSSSPAKRRPAVPALLALACLLVALSVLPAVSTASAAGPVAHAVLFYSPTCPHCHTLIRDDLPPIMDKNGGRLQILAVDASDPAGLKLFEAAVTAYDVPVERRGVPAVIIGDRFLSGTTDSSEQLPVLLTSYLSQGGAGWPAVPGLRSALDAPGAIVTSSPARLLDAIQPPVGILDRLARDRWGNTAGRPSVAPSRSRRSAP
jgi:hypothetical protein